MSKKAEFPGLSLMWLSLILMLGLSGPVGTFNLDPRVPVVKEGAEGSYFGFSGLDTNSCFLFVKNH